jgi:hypothetical protein
MTKDDMDIACVFSWQLIESQLEWLHKANNLDYLAATTALSHRGLATHRIAMLHREMSAHSIFGDTSAVAGGNFAAATGTNAAGSIVNRQFGGRIKGDFESYRYGSICTGCIAHTYIVE